MLWATLALLGVPIGLVFVGVLAALLWRWSKFKKQDGVFPAKMPLESGSAPGVGEKWPPMSSYALWVHDVLLVHKFPGISRTVLGIVAAKGAAQPADPEEVKRLGENPAVLRFRLDSGAVIQMAAPGDALELAQGPFFTREAKGEDGD